MVVSQLVNHFETLAHDVNQTPSLTEIFKNPVKVQFHPAQLTASKSQLNLSVMASEADAESINNEPLLDDADLFGHCSEPQAEFEPTDFSVVETATRMSVLSAFKPITVISRPESEKSDSEPSSPVQSTHATRSETEPTETERRTSSVVDSKESCSNSSIVSLPCLSRSSSMTSETTPDTPRREVPTLTLTNAETFESIQLPHLDIGEAMDEEESNFSRSIALPEPKGKEVEAPTESFATYVPSPSETDESIQSLVAAQLQASFRYSLAERHFQHQISLGYMPTIHENFQALPFLNEDPTSKTNRQVPVGPAYHPGGLAPRLPSQHPVMKAKEADSRPASIQSDDSASTTKTKSSSKSMKKMPSAIFKGLKRYYVPEVA